MLSLRFPRLWLGLGWLAITLAVVVCLVPMNELPQPPGLNDKSEHIIGYVLLACWFTGIYPKSRYWVIGIGLAILGVLVEFAQGAMHLGRQADPYDVLANCTGVLLGLLMSWLWLGGWAQRVEALVAWVLPGTQKS